MSNTETGGPAFPHDLQAAQFEQTGMTLRDYFAAKMMTGMSWKDLDGSARACYAIADAMLRARKQPTK